MQLYLLTGFLGAGKTTALKKLITKLSHKRLQVIVNEFGKEGIDGPLLAALDVALREINNGSIFCSCRLDKFEEVLADAVAAAPDIILVEASGLSDPTNIYKILTENPRFTDITYGGSICIADAINLEKVFATARVCKKQLSIADLILINKTDTAPPEQIEKVEALIQGAYPDKQLRRTSFGEIQDIWLQNLRPTTPQAPQGIQVRDITLQDVCITIAPTMTLEQLKSFLRQFIEDSYRIKGFANLQGQQYLIDCVGALVQVLPYQGVIPTGQANKIVALAGAGMALRKAVQAAAAWYQALIVSID